MSRAQARVVAAQVSRDLRKLTYAQCRKLMERVETKLVIGADGKEYQVEIQAFWDDGKKQDIRVLVSADDKGISAFAPSSDSFIISPGGLFVGEETS